jgi:hypothetical protein
VPRRNNAFRRWPVAVALLLIVAIGGCQKGSQVNERVSASETSQTTAAPLDRPASPPPIKPSDLPPDIDTTTLEMLRELRDHWTNSPNPNQ